MPVGFYYKTFIRPRFAWQVAERVIRRATGVGALPSTQRAERDVVRNAHCDVLVVGGGIAGLAAARRRRGGGRARGALRRGDDREHDAPGGSLGRIRALEAELRALPGVTLLERHAAIGIYEGRGARSSRTTSWSGDRRTRRRRHGRGGDPSRVPRERPARRVAGARRRPHGRRPRRASRRGRGHGRRHEEALEHIVTLRRPASASSRSSRRRRSPTVIPATSARSWSTGGGGGARRQGAGSVVLRRGTQEEALRVRHARAVDSGSRRATRSRGWRVPGEPVGARSATRRAPSPRPRLALDGRRRLPLRGRGRPRLERAWDEG